MVCLSYSIRDGILNNPKNNRSFCGVLIGTFALQQTVEFCHGLGLDGVYDVDVGFHGLVVGMASPFHNDVWGDSHDQIIVLKH